VLAFVAITITACGGSTDSQSAPPAPTIERLDDAPPPLPQVDPWVKPTTALVVARLDAEGAGESLYVGEWPEEPLTTTACYFVFAGGDEPRDAEPGVVLCDRLDDPLHIYERAEYGGWPDASVGTLDASIDSVRLVFDGDCGTETYQATGPLLRSSPTRRIFMLDQGNGCLWNSAEAIRDGAVVMRYEKPAAPRD
jgi:hypothetical protein